jgi:hypothetical protein
MLVAKTISPLSDRFDFETHLKYVSVLAKLARGLSVSTTAVPVLSAVDLPKIKDKMRLIELTKQSVKDEHTIVQIDKDYSTAAVLWLPIKSYYLAYHLLCVIDYIITGKTALLRAKHWECVEHFTKMLADGSLQFSEPILNQVFDKSILNFKTAPGEILRKNVPDDVVYKAIMRKVANEKIIGFKLSKGITHTRSAVNRKEVEKYKQTMTVSIFDFFYQMRLRLNYRNFDFVDNVPASQTKAYFDGYFTAAGYFFSCFSNLKNKLVADISVGTAP